jgi:hypothetical protein
MGESKKDALRVNFGRKMNDKQKEMKKITVLGAGPSQALFSPPRSRSTIHPATSPISTVPHRPDTLSSAPSRISRVRTLRSRV